MNLINSANDFSSTNNMYFMIVISKKYHCFLFFRYFRYNFFALECKNRK